MDVEQLKRDIEATLAQAMARPGFSVDDYLDARDEAPFDAAWSLAAADVDDAGKGQPEAARHEQEAGSKALREWVFKNTAERTGDPELAAYVSDDAGLILEASLAGMSSAWIDSLRRCYALHRLPQGDLSA
jgi:hypothetical protein